MTLCQFCTAAHAALVDLTGDDSALDTTQSRTGLAAAIILARSLGRAEGELGKQAAVPVDPFAAQSEDSATTASVTRSGTRHPSGKSPAELRQKFAAITDTAERSAFYLKHRDQLFAR